MGKMRAAGEGDWVLGERVRQRRKALGLTAKRLARAAGVSPAYLSQIEHGKHLRPSPEVLDALATALALTPAALAPGVVPPAGGAAAEAGASSPLVPPALAALAAEEGIDATTVAMLGGIQVEGRQPATREGWLLVLLAIQAACGGGLPVAPVSLIPHPKTNGDELAVGGRDGEMNTRDGGGWP